jgi:hypothetical protein
MSCNNKAMPYDLRLDLTMASGGDDSTFNAQERNAFTVPTLHGEGIEHSHAGEGDIDMTMDGGNIGYDEYDADVESDSEINEAGLNDIIQKRRYISHMLGINH